MKRATTLLAAALLFVGCAGLYVTRDEIANLEQGMTEREVVERIGKPVDINRTKRGDYVRAQFVYEMGGYERAYVYFEDHKLTSVQY